MSKNNNNKNTDKNMDDHSKERKIRQVFPNGDVSGNAESPKDKEGHPKEEKRRIRLKRKKTRRHFGLSGSYR